MQSPGPPQCPSPLPTALRPPGVNTVSVLPPQEAWPAPGSPWSPEMTGPPAGAAEVQVQPGPSAARCDPGSQ